MGKIKAHSSKVGNIVLAMMFMSLILSLAIFFYEGKS